MCKVKCNKCDHSFSLEITLNDCDFQYISSEEREMGFEVLYSCEYDFICPNCGEKGTLKIDCWEYPEGAFNYCDPQVSGDFSLEDKEGCCSVCEEYIKSKFK